MLSIVIPLYNEEVLVDELLNQTFAALSEVKQAIEVVCVDDGSTDNTLANLKAYHDKEPRLKVVVLSRNFGHQAAYTAGLHHAKGEYVAMMDGDLQDPPELIPHFLQKLQFENFDVVVGRRTKRNEKRRKRFTIWMFHKLFGSISEIQNIEDSGNFCLMNRKVVNALLSMKEKTRYLPGLRKFVGFRSFEFDYDRPDRELGQEKMTFSKLMKLGMDAIFSFSNIPIRICFFLGSFGVIISLLAFLHTFISKLMGWAPFGWSSTYLSIYFLGAVQLMFLGIIGEYVYRIYKEIQNRPSYFVREVVEAPPNLLKGEE